MNFFLSFLTDFFRVLVMDNGRVIEYGSVDNLRDNENSVFGKMIMKNESILDNLK